MSEREKKIIYFLLISIIILSSYLVYKIKSKPKYDEELYKEVYLEYENIFKSDREASRRKEIIDTDIITNKDNAIYMIVDSQGNKFRVAGRITIPKINIQYPIIYETTEEYLKIAPTKLCGPEVNEIGNLCIVGHNYRNEQFFSKISELEVGDKVYLTPNNGKEMKYLVYDKYEIKENDMKCISQETNENIELTLITCVKNKKNRLVVRCRVAM